jgi:recombination protein RecA
MFAVTLVKNIQKRLGQQKSNPENVALMSSDILSEVKEWIPTGFPDLDRILGGGWPVGRASEVFGQEGCGKSALSHMAVLACQKAGGVPIYIDFESALDPDKMEQLGIRPDRCVYARPKDIEEAWDIIWEALDTLEANPPPAPTLIVWDSVAASVPRAETTEKSSGDNHVGLVARSMSKGCRKMFLRIAQVKAHMMWINQERDKIGGFSGFGDNKQTTGGAAIRYAASLRVRCARVSTLKVGTKASGYLIQTSTKKNRCAPPHQKSTWVLDFSVGPSPELTAFQGLLDGRVIKAAGGGKYKAPWSEEPFGKLDWLRLCKESSEFRKGAKVAYAELVKAAASSTGEGEEDDGDGD